jgi:beta-galactosidase
VQGDKPMAKDMLIRMNSTEKSEDYTRPSVIATCYDEVPGTYSMDLVAHNKYFGWYTGSFADFPKWLDSQHKKNPGGCQGMAEFGAGAGINTHSSIPRALDHSEEWQALFHEAYWRDLRGQSWVWCKAVWQMFDSASVGRNEGERKGVNDKGLVTRDRKVKKDAFFWYKVNWDPSPMVYITSKRFTPRTEKQVPVKVYSNCGEVELILNGKSLGKRKVDDHVALWNKIGLSAGKNRLQVLGLRDGAVVTDICTWVLNPKP